MSESRLPVFAPWIPAAAERYVVDCVRSGWLSSAGPYVRRFEDGLRKLCDAQHALATSNGTSALHLALAAAGIGPGDEVIVPALTFVATANVATYAGARAVIADVDAATWTLDPADVEARLTPRTRAIVAVHLYGHPADMDALAAITRPRGIFLLEDAAEAHGARYKGRPAGTLGDAGAFSFYGNKIISTGEGGMLVTNDPVLARRAAFLRDHAMSAERHYFHEDVGFNYRMTNLQAAVGCAQLEEFETILARKHAVTARYRARLTGIAALTLPPAAPWAENVHWMFSVLVPSAAQREPIRRRLAERGIETRPFFVPLHQLPPYAYAARCPVADDLGARGINLPSGPRLTDADVDRVCDELLAAMA